jgi:hypothetical protein
VALGAQSNVSVLIVGGRCIRHRSTDHAGARFHAETAQLIHFKIRF